MQAVDGVNLVNQHGSELILSKAFEEQAATFARTNRGFRLITFDFHKQCGATSYHKCVPAPDVIECPGPGSVSTLRPSFQAATSGRCHLLVSSNCAAQCMHRGWLQELLIFMRAMLHDLAPLLKLNTNPRSSRPWGPCYAACRSSGRS